MTPNKLPPLPEPDITDGNHRLFPEYGRGCSGYSAEQVRFITGSLQAKIDMLMLEHCPDEMTPEQMATWAAHQVPMPAAAAEALRQSQSLPAGAVAVTDTMVDAYLRAQRNAIDSETCRPNAGGLHRDAVRDACKAGLAAALGIEEKCSIDVDAELPGMWSASDFMSIAPDVVRGPGPAVTDAMADAAMRILYPLNAMANNQKLREKVRRALTAAIGSRHE